MLENLLFTAIIIIPLIVVFLWHHFLSPSSQEVRWLQRTNDHADKMADAYKCGDIAHLVEIRNAYMIEKPFEVANETFRETAVHLIDACIRSIEYKNNQIKNANKDH